VQRDAEAHLRANLPTGLLHAESPTTAVTQLQRPGDFGVAAVESSALASQEGDPDIFDFLRLTAPVAHRLEQRRSRRILAQVIEHPQLRVALHIRLAHQDVDQQRLGLRLAGAEAGPQCKQ
jgi:hypothetical protein